MNVGEDGAVPPEGQYGYDEYGQTPFTGQSGTEADKFWTQAEKNQLANAA